MVMATGCTLRLCYHLTIVFLSAAESKIKTSQFVIVKYIYIYKSITTLCHLSSVYVFVPWLYFPTLLLPLDHCLSAAGSKTYLPI